MKNHSLNREIWKYFFIFSILILFFLWTFQVLFLDKYYRYAKINDIEIVAKIIDERKNSLTLIPIINQVSLDKEVCVEIVNNNQDNLYTSFYRGKGCLSNEYNITSYKQDFIASNLDKKTYEIVNSNYNNNTLVYAMKLDDERFAFVNTSLEPISSTAGIIRSQLIVITIIIVILSFVLSYFISNYISNPIIKISNAAKDLAKGKFDTEFISNTNILELNELAETLNYTKDELSKTDELRRDLMANISHDLKTPLTMIKAYAEMSTDLHSNNLEKQKEDMQTIINETDRLTNLVNDILTLSSMQTNIDELEIERFDIVKLSNEILERYKVLQEMENYELKVISNKKIVFVEADLKKIDTVIYNLVNNAINYTGNDNKVTIKINDNAERTLVEIIDTGKGIKDEDLPFIWDRYYKNKKKHKRNLVGTGLGLSIVKSVLESHKFKFGVNTVENKGTTFYFEIKKL